MASNQTNVIQAPPSASAVDVSGYGSPSEVIRIERHDSGALSGDAACANGATARDSDRPNARRRALVQEAQGDAMSVLVRRPDRMSVAFHRPSTESSLGLRLERERNGAIKITEKQVGSGVLSMCNPSALLPNSEHALTFFQPGDTLESINDYDCSDYKGIRGVSQYLSEHDGLTTVVVSPKKQSGSAQRGDILCQAIALTRKSNEPQLPPSATSSGVDLGVTFVKRRGMLQIHKLRPDGWLGKNSVLGEGDLVAGINDNPCLNLDADDAQALLEAKAQFSPCVSITAIAATARQKRWAKAKKAAVGAGGGTMVGVGAVIMATPLHPLGHAMAIGGVAVLGTTFDAPKRALQKSSDGTKGLRARRRRSSQGEQSGDDDDCAGSSADGDGTKA